ncbi:HD domain-containing protein [Psychrobium sp. MM17-31]|uniref:HD domain-containing protein n=1 Tax=Psychrobium sp. MM17-31 TaxID=2917758 RepID=UPI001EF402DF|nr:HD domain-containing protein [Psychrobium sp. MM17-31]MCG7532517.1 HD domain-containing protein [Psychrobium sp. MM17-31]
MKTLEWQPIFQQFVEQQMAFDPAHDLAHIKRVVASGISLAQSEGAELAIVLPACWLHDCVNVPKDSPDRSKGSVFSADRAIEFLKEVDYPSQYFDAIHHAIAAHSYSANIATQTKEAEVVQDADRLDALGAIGLSRCVMLGATWGSELYDPKDPFAKDRELDDKNFCIDHFFVKLQGLVDTMKTPSGLSEAQARWQFMRQYLSQLAHETGASPTF